MQFLYLTTQITQAVPCGVSSGPLPCQTLHLSSGQANNFTLAAVVPPPSFQRSAQVFGGRNCFLLVLQLTGGVGGEESHAAGGDVVNRRTRVYTYIYIYINIYIYIYIYNPSPISGFMASNIANLPNGTGRKK